MLHLRHQHRLNLLLECITGDERCYQRVGASLSLVTQGVSLLNRQWLKLGLLVVDWYFGLLSVHKILMAALRYVFRWLQRLLVLDLGKVVKHLVLRLFFKAQCAQILFLILMII